MTGESKSTGTGGSDKASTGGPDGEETIIRAPVSDGPPEKSPSASAPGADEPAAAVRVPEGHVLVATGPGNEEDTLIFLREAEEETEDGGSGEDPSQETSAARRRLGFQPRPEELRKGSAKSTKGTFRKSGGRKSGAGRAGAGKAAGARSGAARGNAGKAVASGDATAAPGPGLAKSAAGSPDDEDTVVQPQENRRWVIATTEVERPKRRFPKDWEYLPPETLIKERYAVLEMVGQGGMGQVYKALDRRREEIGHPDPYVALKVLKPALAAEPTAVRAFKREAATAQSLSSQRVVEVIDYDQDEELHFIVSEFLKGESLHALLKRLDGKPMEFRRALSVIRDLAEALRHAHSKGVVHADFKPGNAFVCQDGPVKLLDFGVARTFGAASPPKPATGDALDLQGITPAYASCEVLEGRLPDPRDDIYSLSVVAYRLLSGRHPFNGRTALEAKSEGLRPNRIRSLRPAAWRTLRRGLAFDRRDRLPTMHAFIAGFTAYGAGANVRARFANMFGR